VAGCGQKIIQENEACRRLAKVNRISTTILVLIVTFLTGITAVKAQQTKKHPCFKIGDTVTIRGHIVPWTNGGTYFQLADSSPCISGVVGNVVALGQRLPQNVYLEVTGRLTDVYPIVGVGIQTTSFKNIDEEVKAELTAEKLSCVQWQDANVAALSKRAHGASVVRDPQQSGGGDYKHYCGIWSVDAQLPHKEFIVRRPTP
jgi:hypothetical protein